MFIMKNYKQETEYFLKHKFEGDFLINEPLTNHTWYKIGGPVDFLVYPKNLIDLKNILSFCLTGQIPVYFLGLGANILVNDPGLRGVIIKLSGYFNFIEKSGDLLKVGAGTRLQDLIIFCEKNELGGLEYLSGIPGTVGGALIMNAGIDKGVISDVVEEVLCLDIDFNELNLKKSEISFGYRSAPELQDKIIFSCFLKFTHQDEEKLRKIRLEQLEKRRKTQPVEYPSCGSVFKRPPGYFAGKLIEDAGLKGFRKGDAMISDKHAGFIVNLGQAKAKDVKYLIDKIQDVVLEKFNVLLEPEVRFLGF